MKSFILIALTCLGTRLAICQDFPIDPDTKKINYTEVVLVPGADKNLLYLRAKAFAGPPMTKIEDSKEDARYVAKGQIKTKYPASMKGFFHEGFINYTVSIAGKDGKYKYEITDITHTSTRGDGGKLENTIPECGKYTLTLEGWAVIKSQAKAELPKIAKALKEAMDKPATAETKKSRDDW
jgi:hypothetical protein